MSSKDSICIRWIANRELETTLKVIGSPQINDLQTSLIEKLAEQLPKRLEEEKEVHQNEKEEGGEFHYVMWEGGSPSVIVQVLSLYSSSTLVLSLPSNQQAHIKSHDINSIFCEKERMNHIKDRLSFIIKD